MLLVVVLRQIPYQLVAQGEKRPRFRTGGQQIPRLAVFWLKRIGHRRGESQHATTANSTFQQRRLVVGKSGDDVGVARQIGKFPVLPNRINLPGDFLGVVPQSYQSWMIQTAGSQISRES